MTRLRISDLVIVLMAPSPPRVPICMEALPQAEAKDCQLVLHLASGGPTQKGELLQMPHSRTNAVILSNSTEPYHCHGMPCQYPPIWKC
jgi:hypothetical protein